MDDLLDDGLVGNITLEKDVKYAGFWIRSVAAILDFLILLPLFALSIYNDTSIKSISLMVVLSLISAVYKPLLEWKKSTTYGKMAVGIRLVDRSMNNIHMEQAMRRYVPWMISVLIQLVLNVSIYLDPSFDTVTEFANLETLGEDLLISNINLGYSLIFILIMLTVAFDRKKQGLHDKYAETYCIYK